MTLQLLCTLWDLERSQISVVCIKIVRYCVIKELAKTILWVTRPLGWYVLEPRMQREQGLSVPIPILLATARRRPFNHCVPCGISTAHQNCISWIKIVL